MQAYHDAGALVTDPKAIWNRYRKQIINGLWLDVLSLLPFDWLLEAGGQPVWSVAFRLTRLIQLTQAATYLRSLETSPGVNVLLIRLSKTVIVYLLMSHLEGCAWFGYALPDHFGEHEWLPPKELIQHSYLSQYLRVLYWGLATLSDRIENPNPYTAATTAFMVMTQVSSWASHTSTHSASSSLMFVSLTSGCPCSCVRVLCVCSVCACVVSVMYL